jgi:hypothetical protein
VVSILKRVEKKEAKGVYFVSVRDHVAIRRTILESLRDLLNALQRFHDFHHRRQEKAHVVSQLRMLVNKTHKLVFRLKTAMPDVKLPPSPRVRKVVEAARVSLASAQVPLSAEKPKVAKPKSELDALEDELSVIEKKLSKLT